jgi:hypothetical protein
MLAIQYVYSKMMSNFRVRNWSKNMVVKGARDVGGDRLLSVVAMAISERITCALSKRIAQVLTSDIGYIVCSSIQLKVHHPGAYERTSQGSMKALYVDRRGGTHSKSSCYYSSSKICILQTLVVFTSMCQEIMC